MQLHLQLDFFSHSPTFFDYLLGLVVYFRLERFGMILLAGYSAKYRMSIVDELLERRQTAQLWHQSRENLRSEHWELTGHIKRLSEPNDDGEVRRDTNGKRLVMRYSTELDMMNRIVLGMSAKKFKAMHKVEGVRDATEQEDIKLLDDIHDYNKILLTQDIWYYNRKAQLGNYAIVVRDRVDELIEQE